MVQRWYRATVAPSRWIPMDPSIQVDPTAGCNGGTVPLLHRSRTPELKSFVSTKVTSEGYNLRAA